MDEIILWLVLTGAAITTVLSIVLLVRLSKGLGDIGKEVRNELREGREETRNAGKELREEVSNGLKSTGETLFRMLENMGKTQQTQLEQMTKQLKEITESNQVALDRIRTTFDDRVKDLQESNEKKLEEMRKTVDEKLQKTLNERLSQSFDTVSKQLQAVQEGLGEMKNLATDVGGLKKVLSNVKMRGGLGEIQLSMLLEQILAPEQYEANVKIKPNTSESVEFAIKLPGKDESDNEVWLPIDAKFPKDVYEKLQEAYDDGDQNNVLNAQKNLENTIKKMAKEISDKYIDPPNTTDFGIMFLPFEGIYAEVVRKAALLEELQRNFKIIVTGPTTLAAILNSLQMGFKTLAIQKRSSEVWQVLGAVKKEFGNFGGLMKKAQKNIQTGLNQLDDVMGKRTRAIQRRLKSVEAVSETDAKNLIPELNEPSLDYENDEEGDE